jgi:hypothetical protein
MRWFRPFEMLWAEALDSEGEVILSSHARLPHEKRRERPFTAPKNLAIVLEGADCKRTATSSFGPTVATSGRNFSRTAAACVRIIEVDHVAPPAQLFG